MNYDDLIPSAPIHGADSGVRYEPPAAPVWPAYSRVRADARGRLFINAKLKSKGAALILALLFGGHILYLGFGFKKFLIRFILTCWIIGIIPTIIDMIKIVKGKMTDANGDPLK